MSFLEKKNSNLPNLIFLDKSLETHIFGRPLRVDYICTAVHGQLSRVTQKGPLAYFLSILIFLYFLNVYDVKI